MRPISWTTLLHTTVKTIGARGRKRARELIARLGPAPVAPPQLERLDGPELARQRLHQAAAALLGKGATSAETFRVLRLEINRLEQGGLERSM